MKGKDMAEKSKEYEPSFYERCILHSIISLSSDKNRFYQNNDKIAELFDLTENSVRVMISHLVTSGYITKEKKDGYRYLYYTGKKFKPIPVFASVTKAQATLYKNQNMALRAENAKLKEEIEDLKKKLSV